MTALPSVQRLHTRYGGIADDTLYLDDGRSRAIFEIQLPDLSLVDDDTLEVATARLGVFLHALEFPFQLLFRLVRVDLEEDARETERLAAARSAPIARAGREHAAFLRHLERTNLLLELRAYVVIGLEGAAGSLVQRLARRLKAALRRFVPAALRRRLKVDRTLAGPSDTELLDACGEETAYALESLGTSPRRLDDLQIADLLYSCWCPERASQQPLVPVAVARPIATPLPTSSDAAATGPGAATAKAAAARARRPGAS
jgi:hypothetical protein